MVTITQFVYVKEGQELVFQEFESLVLPLLSRYNGKLLLRLRTDREQLIEGELDAPYEIHLVRFVSEADMAAYLSDPVRIQFLHLKDESVTSVITVKEGV